MKQLDEEVKSNNRIYKQVKRTSDKAMYKSDDGIIEVFKIKIAPEAEIYGKKYPEREVYPGNEDFGKIAWCFTRNIKEAENKYNLL